MAGDETQAAAGGSSQKQIQAVAWPSPFTASVTATPAGQEAFIARELELSDEGVGAHAGLPHLQQPYKSSSHDEGGRWDDDRPMSSGKGSSHQAETGGGL